MRWVRRNRGIGAWAALFAFALQIALSFGHVHLPKIASSSASTADISLTSGDGAPSPDRHGGATDVCAICAAVGLVASSVLPEASAVVPPAARAHRCPSEFANSRIAFDPFFLFQARAPPTVL
jgi:hypothetical protein